MARKMAHVSKQGFVSIRHELVVLPLVNQLNVFLFLSICLIHSENFDCTSAPLKIRIIIF